MRAEQITSAVTYHGEGPVWWPDWGGLRFVDTYVGDIMHLRQDGIVDRWNVADTVTSIRPRQRGGLVLSTSDGIGITDEVGGQVRMLTTEFIQADQRLNDGGCDPQGRFWCGSIDFLRRGSGEVFRIAPEGRVTRMLSGVNISNGLAWSNDGTYMYFADSFTKRVDRFVFDDGEISHRETFAVIDQAGAIPDGICVDAEDGVWVALWNGNQVRRYAATGELDYVIELPVGKVSACTFGGADLDELWITTSREDELDPHPSAGAVFRAVPGVKGLPIQPFAG